MEIKWNKLAVKQLLDAIRYLEDNEQFAYAEKIESNILAKIKFLPEQPEIYQPDRLKKIMTEVFMRLRLTIIEFPIENYLKK